ncbi:MAG TPA: hypothetical protein VGC58_00780 [Candidatus Paceibacterota bacterium]
MVLSTVAGATSPATIKEIPKVENTVTENTLVKPISKKEVEKMMSTEEYVRQYFQDIPIMIQIAKCESRFRHLDDDGEVHRGVQVREDTGVMQINEYYHLNTAEKRGFDIYTLEGNTAYARDLYERQGTGPWKSSKACWGKYEISNNLAINK